jgi:hypothetical protein
MPYRMVRGSSQNNPGGPVLGRSPHHPVRHRGEPLRHGRDPGLPAGAGMGLAPEQGRGGGEVAPEGGDDGLVDAPLDPDRRARPPTNDVPTLEALFWDDPRTIRYGIGENLYGMDAIRAAKAASTSAFTSGWSMSMEIILSGLPDCTAQGSGPRIQFSASLAPG